MSLLSAIIHIIYLQTVPVTLPQPTAQAIIIMNGRKCIRLWWMAAVYRWIIIYVVQAGRQAGKPTSHVLRRCRRTH